MNKKTSLKIVLFLIILVFTAGFFLVPEGITGYTVFNEVQSVVLTDVQIYSDEPISPALEITIPPENPSTAELDLTYKYVQIKQIQEKYDYAEIYFQVSRSWITANNLYKQDIALYIFDNEWKQIPSFFENEDEGFIYYKARVNEFGLFAIAKSPKESFIEEFTPEPVSKKQTIPFLIIIAVLLLLILLIGLLSLMEYKFRFILVVLAFAIILLALTIQQPVTKDILMYGIIPLSILALVASTVLTILLEKLRTSKTHPYIRNMMVFILFILIIITSTTKNYNLDVILYAVIPLIVISAVVSFIFTFFYYATSRLFRKNNSLV